MNPERDWSAAVIDDALKERLMQASKEHFKKSMGNGLIFYFRGPYGAGKELIAEVLCQDLKLPLMIVDARDLSNVEANFEKAIRLLFR